ncbi:MAG TPA: putative manganese transporter [Anaerovoracaceae bacterium]|nr:putative manganese transporter [Anaerovoracaceae bacterium]
MIGDLWAIVVNSAEGSFVQVTVFVGAVLLLFGYIDFQQQGAFVDSIERLKKYQPLIGALLGILPGCGGSIFLMPLYLKGTVTFGTIVATLIATSGDAAFVTLTQAPKVFFKITVICFFVGTFTGYIVDYLKIGDWVKKKSPKRKMNNLEGKHETAESTIDAMYESHEKHAKMADESFACRSCELKHIGHEEGDEIDMLLHHRKPLDPGKFGYRLCHNYYMVFWIVISLGFVLGVIELTQKDINNLPGLPNIGMIMGLIGTAVTLFYMICSKKFIQAQTHEDEEHKLFSLKETFAHNAQETAFVGTWVFFAYLVYELGVYFAGGEQVIANVMTSAGLTSVFVGVLIGIIPGCGPQVIFVSLYLKGMFPFAALLANSISQDGDALFPLIAMDRKAAFWATVINTIPAILVGVVAYFIEIG